MEYRTLQIIHTPFAQTNFPDTKAVLKMGDLIEAGQNSNCGGNKNAKSIYLTTTLQDAAIWGAELAIGNGRERIYLVNPTGEIGEDPNLTDKIFPGKPTLSFRSKYPFKVVSEITFWKSHPEKQLLNMKKKLHESGVEANED